MVNNWQLTGAEDYLVKTLKIWSFIMSGIIDYDHGEWYWGVDPDGERIRNEDKVSRWKCPYHNSHAMIELLQRLPE